MNFRNQKFHTILDWRLGLSYLRMLKGGEEDLILSADSNLHEFKNFNGEPTWLKGFNELFKNWVETLEIGKYHERYGLPICLNGNEVIIGTHPLWDIRNPKGLLEKVVTEQKNNDRTIKFIDSFNILRRPGACKQALVVNNQGINLAFN